MGLFKIGFQELALYTSNSVFVCPTQKRAEPFSGLSLIRACTFTSSAAQDNRPFGYEAQFLSSI